MLGRQLGRGSAMQEALSVQTLGLKQPAATLTAGMLPAASFLTLALDAGLTAERQFVAGAGLGGTDSGAGSTYTLDVNVGSGINIVADAVAVDATVARNTWAVNAGAGLTGGGNLASAGITLDVVAGDGSLTVAANDVRVAQGFAFNWTGAQTWSNTAAFNGVTSFSGGIGSSLIPSLTDTYDLGSSIKLWRKGWLSELDAILFAQNTVTLLGGWFMVTPDEGVLPADSGVGTTVNFGKAMTLNAFVLFRAAGAVEYMKVGTLVSGTTYNVTRDLDGSGINNWVAGSVFAVLGTSGQGRIELNSYDTPRISILEQGATYNAQTERLRVGDLNGNWGYVSAIYGMAIGEYATGLPNLTYDTTNGLRLRVYNGTPVLQLDTSGNADITNKLRLPGASSALAIGATPPTAANAGTGLWLDRTGFYSLSAGTYQVKIDAVTGQLLAGGGAVTLDATGLVLATGTAVSNSVNWYNAASAFYPGSMSVGLSGNLSQGNILVQGKSNTTDTGSLLLEVRNRNNTSPTQGVRLEMDAYLDSTGWSGAYMYGTAGTFKGLQLAATSADANIYGRLDVRGKAAFGAATAVPARDIDIFAATPYLKFAATGASVDSFTIGADAGGFVIYDDTAGGYRAKLSNTGNLTIVAGDVFANNNVKGLMASLDDLNIYDCSANLNLTTALQDVAGVTTGAFTPGGNEWAYVEVAMYINQAAGTAACVAADVLNGTLLLNGVAQTRVMQGTATGATGFACYKGMWKLSLTAVSTTIKLQAKNTTGARGLVNTATHMQVWRVAR